MKKDLKILIFLLSLLLLLVILSLSSISKDISSKSDKYSNIFNSKIFKVVSAPSEYIEKVALNIKEDILLNPKSLYIQDNTKVEKEEEVSTEKELVINEAEVIKPEVIKPKKNNIQLPLKALLIGDSLIIEKFGPAVEQRLKSIEGIDVYREGHYSTGINRIDYYDWYKRTRELISSYNPDILIVFLGANDGQNIHGTDGSYGKWPSTNWDSIYKERVDTYLSEFSPLVDKIYWIGHPIPRTTDFQSKFSKMNSIYISSIEEYKNVKYIDSWNRFAVNGAYSPTLADDTGLVQYVKASDGVHLTHHGSKILTDLLIQYMKEDIEF